MLSLIFSCLLQSVPALFNESGRPTKELSAVLEVAQEIRHSDEPLTTKTEINAYLQRSWLRQAGSERNELGLSETMTPKQANTFRAAFSELDMIGPQSCTGRHSRANEEDQFSPSVIVILGGGYPNMEKRVSFAVEFSQSLQKKPLLILLTGDRDLEKMRKDSVMPLDAGAPTEVKTEEEAGKYLADQHKDLSIILLNSPKQPGTKRATTADNAKTLQSWLIEHKIKGTVMLISTEPHGPYQLLSVQKNCQIDGVSFDVCAVPLPGPFDNKMIAICMDALARMVFTEMN